MEAKELLEEDVTPGKRSRMERTGRHGSLKARWSRISPSVSTTFRCSSRLPSAPFAPPYQRFWLRLPEQAHKRGMRSKDTQWHARPYQKKHSLFFFLATKRTCSLACRQDCNLDLHKGKDPSNSPTPLFVHRCIPCSKIGAEMTRACTLPSGVGRARAARQRRQKGPAHKAALVSSGVNLATLWTSARLPHRRLKLASWALPATHADVAHRKTLTLPRRRRVSKQRSKQARQRLEPPRT